MYTDFCNQGQAADPSPEGYVHTVIFLVGNAFILTSHSLVTDDKHLLDT